MKSIVIATALTLGASLAMAQAQHSQQDPGNRSYNEQPGDYWKQNAKDGYMTKDQAMKYKGKDGKSMEYTKMDTDKDGRVSMDEWSKYHGMSKN